MKTTMIRKRIALIVMTMLAALMFNCSGGGGLSASGKTSTVTIAVSGLRNAARSAASVPGGVASITISISAPDMETISRTVNVSGKDSIEESFDVPVGVNRHFLAVAYSADGSSSLYQGDVSSDLDETPKNIDILMGFDISGEWTITSAGPKGAAGLTTVLTVTQTGNSLTLSGKLSDGGSFVGSGTVIGNNYQSTATGSDCGNSFSRNAAGTVSSDGQSMSGNFTLSGGCPGFPGSGSWSAEKITACTYTYSDWSVCQADGTQSRTVLSSSPAGCAGTPLLTQPCSYVPPPLPAGFPTDVPTGNYNVSIQVCVEGICYSGTSFPMVNADINQFAQSLLDALNTAAQSQNSGCDQTAGCSCTPAVISYAPWNGTSFTILYAFSETCNGQTTTASIQFIISKI